MYLDNNTAYIEHVKKLKHRNDVRLINGNIKKSGVKFDCVTPFFIVSPLISLTLLLF